MEILKLRFANDVETEVPLGVGVHGVGLLEGQRDRLGLVAGTEAPKVLFCVDRRGIWLNVSDGTRGVHVNGREVRRMAMLRIGDAIYVDGAEMRLVASNPPGVPAAALSETAADAVGDPRVVLRGVGGQYHGRSFTLEQPRLVGRSSDADIRIDDPSFADRHARLELIGDEIVLRDLGSVDGSVVNGESVRDALLQTGDQIVFDAHHRFVVEAPVRSRSGRDRDEDSLPEMAALPQNDSGDGPSAWRLPWLLLAALIIAGMLAALLLFGTG